MERFIDYKQLAIPETVIAFTESIQVKDNDGTVVNDQGVQEFHRHYLEFRERCRVGDFGRTAQFWVALYLDIIEVLHMIHNAVDQRFRSSNDCMEKDAAILLCYEQN